MEMHVEQTLGGPPPSALSGLQTPARLFPVSSSDHVSFESSEAWGDPFIAALQEAWRFCEL